MSCCLLLKLTTRTHQPTPEQRVPKTLGPFSATSDNDKNQWIDIGTLIFNYVSILNHGNSLDGMLQLYKSASFAATQ